MTSCCADSASTGRDSTSAPRRRLCKNTGSCVLVWTVILRKRCLCLCVGRAKKAGTGAVGHGKAGLPRGLCGASSTLPVAGAVRVHNQAQFHPLKFVCCLAKGLHIYEHTPVRELIGTTAVTDSGKVAAKAVIVHTSRSQQTRQLFSKAVSAPPYVIALKTPRMWTVCMWMRRRRGCHSETHGICCWWAAAGIARERAEHGGS